MTAPEQALRDGGKRTKIEINLLAGVHTLELDQRGVLILVGLAALEAEEDTLAVQATGEIRRMHD